MEAISKEFMEEYDRGLKQNALVPLNGKVDQLDRTVVKQVRVGDTSYSPENGVVILPEGGSGDAQYANKVFLEENEGVLTQAMVSTVNVVYVIQYDYTISNNIAIPGGCTLEFAGGSLNGGSLSGTVEIINKPADLYEKVNCMELYVTNETHLCVADISELFDRYDKDDLISQDAITGRYSLAHFYCIAGMNKIIFRMPGYAFDNSQGTSYPALPYMRYMFYDRDFKLIDVRPEWTGRTSMYTFTNIPAGAAYINVLFSEDDQLNKPMMQQDVLKYMYFNFLDNTKVYINTELEDNADVIDFTASGRWGSSEIYYNSYSDPSASDTYHIGKYSKGNLSTGSYFIPRSILKNYDFIQLVGHGVGATYTFIDGSTSEERNYNSMIIAFLKKTPLENGEVIEYCDTYPWRIDLHQQQSPIFAIPDDCKCIFVYKAYAWQGTINDCSPKQILLKKKSACDIGGFDTTDLSKISNRDVNTQEIKFVHWNIGADNIGGLMAKQEQVTSELLTKRRDSFNAFFNKINRTHNLLLNEFNYWFDAAHSIDYMTLSSSSVWQGKKRFDTRQYQNLGIFYKNDLLEYRYGTFECLKGFTEMGTSSVRGGRYYSYGYAIYHYPIADANLYVMNTHLPTPISANSMKKLYREMKTIMDQYPNAVIVGDMNDSGNFNPYTHTGNNFLNLEEIFPASSGWHIANKELDNTPTLDFGKDFWNPTQPAAGRTNLILDFCLWKGSYITMSDFSVRRDAIIVGSEALESTENVFINSSGSAEGNEALLNHRLSDHWPVEFTIKPVSSYSIVPDTEGSTRYNPVNKKFQWHNGEEWKDAGGEGGGGGDYLPLTGGTLTGNLTIKGTYNLYRTNNGIASILYPGYRLYDTNGKLSSQFIGIVNPNGYNGFWISALNYNTNGTQVADKGFGFSVDKNGNGVWTIHEPASFRTAIGINLDNLVVGKLKASAFLASNNGVGTAGTIGWVCLANITVNSAWASQPLKFRVTQRGKFGGELTLRFTNVATAADTEVYEFSYTGNIAGARIVKDGADFSLYIKKSESYDSIAISLVDVGAYMNGRVTVTWTDTFSASDPGGTVAVCRQTADDYDAFYCKVLNAAYGSITLSRNYSANGSDVSKRSNEVLANDNFHKGISGIYTITESDTDFVGFPVIVNHKDVLYIFYRRSEYHDLTPNQSTLDIYYKFSVDGGVNWSEEYSIQFPDTPNNTSGSSPSGWNGMHIDWRAYYYASYGNYIYGCTWGCVFYGDGSSSSDRKNYPSVLVRISQNNDKTLTLDKTQWFPEIVLWERDNAITFDSGRMNYYNRPTPNWDDYHGCLVGGSVIIKNGVMYIPVYYGSIGVVSWTINENLNVNSSNFKFVGSLTSSDYNSTAISGSESTVWIDDDGNIKTLVRFDRKSGELGSYKQSRIYSVDTVNKTYTELARCSMCEGPSSVMVESNMAIIIGRGPIAYSNIILYDNTKDEVVSELNQFDTPGYFTNWSDSFYGSISCRKGMYFIAFYKRLSSSKTTINYFTIDRLNLNLNNNYNNKENNTGNVVKKTDVSTDGNYQYLIPCAALVKKTPVYYFYVPNYTNSKRVDLLGTIVFMTSFGTYRNQVDEGEQMTISLKDSVNAVCLLYEYKKRTNSSDSSKLDIDISISYKHGSSYVKYYRVISIANGFNGMLNPAIVANTSTDKSSCILSRLFVEGQTSDYRGYSISKAEGAEAEFDDSVYPDGVKIESSVHARIGAVGALVNGNPILSIVPDDDYAIDMASGNYIYTYTGFMQKASAQGFGYEPSCVSDFNDWILRSVDEVGQV